MPYANNDGIELYFETHGDTGPGLIFAHGAGGNASSWWQQVPEFSATHRVVVFDHRGFARSSCPEAQQSALHFEADLIAVMDAADLERATLVCQSMGGWTGVRAAVNHSDRVRSVLLANTPGAIRTQATIDNTPRLSARVAEGGSIVSRAISSPIRQIAANTGLEGSIVAMKVEESKDINFGFNALTHTYEDLVKAGVIVPTKVERIALQNAASISGLLLTTDCAITEIKEKKSKAPAGGGGMDDMDY